MNEVENFLILVNKLQEKNRDDSFEFIVDSRKIKKGDVFVALVGEKTDGHLFIDEAIRKGASLVVASKKQSLLSDQIFYTKDPIDLIKKVCIERMKNFNPLFIGITGSCGKTSTKAILAQLLKKAFPVFVTKGNANSQIGLPLALMDLRKEHTIAVLEIGMSHQYEILKQVEWIPLKMAIITSIGLSHVENFKDGIEGIAKAKGEILAKNENVEAFFNDQTLMFEPFASYLHKNVYPKKTSSSMTIRLVSKSINN
jgi:UDP-N-acetylmuramoyl-tripeptide--D-alanyl-D-alanine ligase